jgi:DNA-binding NtrC family response regulator
MRKPGRRKKLELKLELLVADFDNNTRSLCTRIAGNLECGILFAVDQESVLDALRHNEVGVVLLDTGTIFQYLDLSRTIKKQSARIEVLIADKHATIPAAVTSIKAGASDYLEKPLNEQILEASLATALLAYRSFQRSVLPLEQLEKQAIEDALAKANGDKIEAARMLSIGKTTLYRKLREYSGHSEQNSGQSAAE